MTPAPSPSGDPSPPVAPGRVAEALARMRFPGSFRPSQALALDAFERSRAAGDRRHYLTLPPGSGKTLLGLEMVRRLGRPAVVLAPNTAIVGQWLDQWSRFDPPIVAASDSTSLAAPLSVLTYQALCVLDRDVSDEDGGPRDADGQASGPFESATTPWSGSRSASPLTAARRRRLVARGGDREAVLGLLHRNGREIVDRIAARGPVTLVLDESHHLLELWGALVAAILGSIHPRSEVVALTATPPLDLGPRERALHDALFGEGADVEVVAPAVVKDGFLAPYQELALVTAPLADEARFITEQAERFTELLRSVEGPDLGRVPFRAWMDRRFVRRRSEDGAQVAWGTLEAQDPDLARAALRWYRTQGSPPPSGARYQEAHRQAPDAADWAVLLGRWATEALAPSDDPRDREAWQALRAGLPSAGYRLGANGVSRGRSVVDRVLALSASKALGTATILSAEAAVLGARLRGLVLCDHESAGPDPGASLRGVLDPGAGSASLVLRTLLDGTAVAGLDPVMVTGRTVACSLATAMRLVDAARDLLGTAALAGGPPPRPGSATERLLDGARALASWDPLGATGLDRWDGPVVVSPADPRWSARTWVPFLTRCFGDGITRCLIGTRALLGEGWDAPSVNVVVDLTTATTRAAVHQMRGRGMRLDPTDPDKVADLWDVVCVADDHPQGGADHARFARKHAHDLALNEAGEIESGVAHVDPVFTPWRAPAPDERAALRERMLARPAQRAAVRAAWRIGQPYRDVPVGTLRVRTRRSPGLPARDPLRRAPGGRIQALGRVRRAAAGATALMVGSALAGALLSGPMVAAAGLALGAVIGTCWLLLLMLGGLRALGPADTLLDLGRAVADGLVATGANGPGSGAATVRVAPQPDGWYRCLLDGVPTSDSERFAVALDQLMAPLWDPRWLIPRPVVEVQPTLTGAARFVLGRLSGRLAGMPTVWHAVPDALAGRREHVLAFEAAWRRWVAPAGHAIPVRDPRAEAVLAARRGDDPFGTEAQLRTLWT